MKELKVIGITGGVGAGKSTILNYLKNEYQAKVFFADLIAKNLMAPGGEIYNKILSLYGEDLKMENGYLNRELLAKRLFEQGSGTEEINKLVHPAVISYLEKKIDQEKMEAMIEREDGLRIVIIEAALLFEGKADKLCDEVWYIYTEEKVRIERLMEDRGYSLEKCQAIISAQKSDEFFRSHCQAVIDNSFEKEKAESQIDEEIRRIRLN